MTADFRLELHCPVCNAKTTRDIKTELKLPQLGRLEWEFECPDHGSQKARPFIVDPLLIVPPDPPSSGIPE